MTKKLTGFMLKALRAIADSGGVAIPEGGGYWIGKTGSRLEVEPEPTSCSGIVGTQTIRALEDRGMLERLWEDQRYWRDHRRLTQAGRSAIT